MSSETSINRDQLQPWQFFTLAGLAAATAVVLMTKEGSPAAVVLLSLTVGAAAFVGLTAWRTFGALAGVQLDRAAEVLGGRTRAALEREKTLVLRAIKDLEFDRAMGKVSEADFAEMSARLRARAVGLLRELDRGGSYREAIERELAQRLPPSPAGYGATGPPSPAGYGATGPPSPAGYGATGPSRAAARPCACGTANDADARFCKSCGRNLYE